MPAERDPTVTSADGLVGNEAERTCLAALRAATHEPDGPMERHCVRQFLIAERLGADAAQEIDREVLLCAALLHDAGLFRGVATGDVYVTDSRRLAERTLAPFGWAPARLARCLDAVEQHHALGSRAAWGTEVELVRRADLGRRHARSRRLRAAACLATRALSEDPSDRLLPDARARGRADDPRAPPHARADLLAPATRHALTAPAAQWSIGASIAKGAKCTTT